MNGAWQPSRLGLAGGLDKDGSRAAELLASGFGSVEFGTVTPQPEPGGNPGVAALAARLSAHAPRGPGGCRIGIGIGMGNAAAELLPSAWVGGLHAAQDVADYLCFNLSARCYRHLLSPDHLPLLLRTFAAVTTGRDRHCRVPLALKLPLGATDAFPLTLAEAAADAGFDAVTAVLPEQAERFDRLHALALRLQGKAAVVAVGGIRSSADVQAALAAGAQGVQVHTLYAQLGAGCLALLLG